MGKIFEDHISFKRLISNAYKELKTLNNSIKQQGKDLIKLFSKEDIWKVNRCMKSCSASVVIGEMQIKTTEASPHIC